jgi:hypothetical protein
LLPQSFHVSTRLDVPTWRRLGSVPAAKHRLVQAWFALLDFSYDLKSPGAQASRAYRVGAARLGVEGVLRLDHGFSLELEGSASLPIPHVPQLAGVTGRAAWALPALGPVHAALFLGCGARWINFEDAQTLPNHIDVRAGPLLTGGFTVSY